MHWLNQEGSYSLYSTVPLECTPKCQALLTPHLLKSLRKKAVTLLITWPTNNTQVRRPSLSQNSHPQLLQQASTWLGSGHFRDLFPWKWSQQHSFSATNLIYLTLKFFFQKQHFTEFSQKCVCDINYSNNQDLHEYFQMWDLLTPLTNIPIMSD